jgi:TrmH family RNA methyltransferase
MATKKITSLQHPLVKRWQRLRQEKNYREETQRVLITGKKMARELPLEVLISSEESDIPAKEKYIVSQEILTKITGLKTSDGFAGEVVFPKEQDLSKKKYILILDQLSDPGNLGTLIRTALAMKWDGVVITPNTVDPFNDKALRASKGAIFHLPFARLSENEIKQWKKNFYTADLEGVPLEKISFKTPLALILSSEGAGPGNWSKELSTKVTIPMSENVESLNVAVSGAIFLYTMRSL